MTRAVAIRLKIPDNEAYTALSTLRRLGVSLAALERADVWVFDDAGSEGDFTARVEANELLFNPNKHELRLLEDAQPRTGEAWIEPLPEDRGTVNDVTGLGRPLEQIAYGKRFVAWRLFTRAGVPADSVTLAQAVEKLLCNPAIEKARIR